MSYLDTLLNNQAYSTCENWSQFRTWLIQEVQDHYDDFQNCNIMAFLPLDHTQKPCFTGGINFNTYAEYTEYFMNLTDETLFCALIHKDSNMVVGFNTVTFGEEIWIAKAESGYSISVDHYCDRTQNTTLNEEVNWPEFFKEITDALLKEVKKAS